MVLEVQQMREIWLDTLRLGATIMTLNEFLTRHANKIRQDGDCLLWHGCINGSGYGCLQINYTTVGAHRAAWECAHGIPIGKAVLLNDYDHCGHTNCVNPDHWKRMTKKASAQILAKQKRLSHGAIHEAKMAVIHRPRAKLNLEIAREIRQHEGHSKVMAEKYGISSGMVNHIRRGVCWKEATPFSI